MLAAALAPTPERETDVTGKLKVLVVCGAVGRSSELWLWRQLVGLKRLRVGVACWAYENRDVYPTPGIATHVLSHPARPPAGPSRWLTRLRNASSGNFYGTVGREKVDLCAVVAAEKPAVMLAHFGHYALRLLPVAVATGVPLVAHFHGLDVSSSLKDRWYRWSLLRSLAKFAAVVVVGEHQHKWMLDHGVPAERLHLIPCGAPVSEYSVHSRPPTEAMEKIRFISVSRLVAWKGVDFTIRAFAQVAAAVPHTEFLVVGDGPERGSLEALAASLGLERRVVFAGACSAEQVRAHYEASHVFLQHSITHSSGWVEGFGVSIVEAAAAGLPVVVTRSGGIGPQVVEGQTGFLIEERDVDAMARAMIRIAQDSDMRTRMGRNGRRHVERHFDSKGQIEKLENVLASVAKPTGESS